MQSSESKDIFIDKVQPSRPSMFNSPNNESYVIASKEGLGSYLNGIIQVNNGLVPYHYYSEGAKHGDPDCLLELYKLYTTTNPDVEPDKEKAIYYLAAAVGNYYLQLREHSETLALFNEYVTKFGDKEVYDILYKGIGDKKSNFDENRGLLKALLLHVNDPSDYERKLECKSALKKFDLNKLTVRRYIATFASNQQERETALASSAFKHVACDIYKDYLLAFNLTGNLLSQGIVEQQIRSAIEATQYLVYQGKTKSFDFNSLRIELSEFCSLVTNCSKLKLKDAEKDAYGLIEGFKPMAHLILGYLYTSGTGLSFNVRKAYKNLLSVKKGDKVPEKVEVFRDYLELVSLRKLARQDENFKGKLDETYKDMIKKYDSSLINKGSATTGEYFIAGYIQERYKGDKVAANKWYSIALEVSFNDDVEYFIEKAAFDRKCKKRIKRLEVK